MNLQGRLNAAPVDVLVAEATSGNPAAWNAIVDRYAALIWSICLRFRLSEADAADVVQTVWLRTVERLSTLREPAALPGWLATTTRRECLKVAGAVRGAQPLGELAGRLPADEETTAPDAELLAAERRAMVREAFAQLPEHCQRLLALLVSEESASYAQISARLGMPVGSIGPTRSRCLDKLRACPAVARWTSSDRTQQAEQQGAPRDA
jgi:RNA polymerase sigma factor (sigma-70 family)